MRRAGLRAGLMALACAGIFLAYRLGNHFIAPVHSPRPALQAESRDAEPAKKVPESAPVETKPEASPSGIPQMSEASFESLGSEVQESLPTLKMLKELPAEEVHGTPDLIREAGMDLGKIARAVQENPQLAARGLEFYTRCAERGDLPRSIRALCLSNAKPLASRLRVEHSISVPASVESLADRAGQP